MTTRSRDPRPFTGRHMLTIIVAFFGVVISVNLTLAVFAGRSWTGLVVENTYVASQTFNEKAKLGREQAALGWTGTLSIDRGWVRYRLVDGAGMPVRAAGANVAFRHPAFEAKDERATLMPDGDGLFAPHRVADGVWIVEIDSDAGLDRPYRDVRRIHVVHGALE